MGFRIHAKISRHTSVADSLNGLGGHPEAVLKSWVDLHRGHSTLLVGTVDETFCVLGVDFPEAAFSWFILFPRDFNEAFVQ